MTLIRLKGKLIGLPEGRPYKEVCEIELPPLSRPPKVGDRLLQIVYVDGNKRYKYGDFVAILPDNSGWCDYCESKGIGKPNCEHKEAITTCLSCGKKMPITGMVHFTEKAIYTDPKIVKTKRPDTYEILSNKVNALIDYLKSREGSG